MTDLMVDIETLGTDYSAVITQIGACQFDRLTGVVAETLLVNVSIQDCLNHGLTVNGGALKFWFEQPQQHYTFLANPVPLSKALQQLREIAAPADAIWAHATFDFPILAHACRAIGQGMFTSYIKLHDIRTLVTLAKWVRGTEPYQRHEKDHNALNDCLYQVKYCVVCFNMLKGNADAVH